MSTASFFARPRLALFANIKVRWAPVAAAAFLVVAGGAQGWGPHGPITQAALDVLGTNHSMALRLGPYFQRLTNYCWLADYRRVPFPDVEMDFYADDYLLFPGITKHYDHICPEVKQTYRPYFQRALMALRTENNANAARWVGSLLHFVEDTGSPPHAGEIRGALHTKLENWLDARRIHIPGYQPALLGKDDDSALQGFLERMDGVIAFSKKRAQRARLSAETGNRSAVEPVVLESALETARVTADLLHTLGYLAEMPQTNHYTLRGKVAATPGVGMERFPGKVMLLNTRYSTLTDAEGAFEFHHLPTASYALIAHRSGHDAVFGTSPSDATNVVELKPDTNRVNLIRNGDFQLNWVGGPGPDCWNRTDLGWEGEIIPLKAGQSYQLNAKFRPDATGDVLIRWTRQLPYQVPNAATLPRVNSRPITPLDPVLNFTATENMALMQVTLRTKKSPAELCVRVELRPVRQ